jgi:starvation-inducible DNA-binding protein
MRPLEISSGREHATALAAALAKFGKSARAAIGAATEFGDTDTADLFTGMSRSVDKLLWQVEAHLQGKD